MTELASSTTTRRLCAVLCLVLVILFAAIQGGNALDRIQHMRVGAHLPQHHHLFLSAATVEETEIRADGHGMDGSMPVHHHHNADHGSSLPVPFVSHEVFAAVSTLRLPIAEVAAVMGRTGHAPERPPRYPASIL